jgi:ribonuclease P protein component
MGLFSFPRAARLRREDEFRRVYRRGTRMRIWPLRFCVLRRAGGKSRLGLSVSRKVGNAVVRNRWKRAVREAFRLNRHKLARPYDMVVSVSWEAEPGEVGRAEEAFIESLRRLNERDGEGGSEDGGS